MSYKKYSINFNRDLYRGPEFSDPDTIFDNENEMCEFNEDADDLASELAHTRHELTRVEDECKKLKAKVEELEAENGVVRRQRNDLQNEVSLWFLEVEHDFGIDTAERIYTKVINKVGWKAQQETGE